MAVMSSVLTFLLISSAVIRSVTCQYSLFPETSPVEKREHNIQSMIYKMEELLEDQKSNYLQSNRISLFPNQVVFHVKDILSNCLQKEITVKLEDNEKEFRPSIVKNIYCINVNDGNSACSIRRLKCVQKYEKVMIGSRMRGSDQPHCWDHTEYNRPAGCQCSP